jgi:hypothetical protein
MTDNLFKRFLSTLMFFAGGGAVTGNNLSLIFKSIFYKL